MGKNISVIHVKTLALLSKLKALPHFFVLASLLLSTLPLTYSPTQASSCPDVKIIFARGSGATRYDNQDYQTFKSTLEAKLRTSLLTYEFDDLDYPAVGISGDKFLVAVGAFFSGGESYEFGDSVKAGADKLTKIVNNSCPDTKYVIAGYSQGAMVISSSLKYLNPDKIIYAATFGDPKIYLPEGAGLMPAACQGKNLSSYRVYVPDCFAYKGLLGAQVPYVTSSFADKTGTWCNRYDIFCSSYYSISSHTSYVEDNLYEDASRFIFSKIATEFNFQNEYTSPHDTAILIDSTGSMSELIADYKAEALRLAEKTLSSGGRVALYDYRDLDDPYEPVEGCNFETCTLEKFKNALEIIEADGGGDEPESLLSASFHAMKNLNWNFGSTKSLVILTDATYHSPDLDGVTFYDVKTLSKLIDPVNFYIITTPDCEEEYEELAEATDGAVASSVDDLSLLTDAIIARYDSLPRVEESLATMEQTPQLEISSTTNVNQNTIRVDYETDASKVVVILNEAILGTTEEKTITITDLRLDQENILTLIPLSDSVRGEPVSVTLNAPAESNTTIEQSTTEQSIAKPDISDNSQPESATVEPQSTILIPKAPNTGKL